MADGATEERPPAPEGMTKLLVNVATGVCMGGVFGSIQSAWFAPRRATDGLEVAVDALPSLKTMWKYVGGNALTLGCVAGVYTLTEGLAASVHGKFDAWTTFSGAFCSGVFVGSRTLSATAAFFYGVGFGLTGLVAHLTQGSYAQDQQAIARFYKYTIVDKETGAVREALMGSAPPGVTCD